MEIVKPLRENPEAEFDLFWRCSWQVTTGAAKLKAGGAVKVRGGPSKGWIEDPWLLSRRN